MTAAIPRENPIIVKNGFGDPGRATMLVKSSARPPDADNADLFDRLAARISEQQSDYEYFDNYYDGLHRLQALGLALPPEMRALEVIVNWPRLVIDSIAERMTVTGFRYGEADGTDDRLWNWWQVNNLDEESRLEHVEAMVQKRGYVCVGASDDPAIPLFTVETRRNLATQYDQRVRMVIAALRLYGYHHDDPAQPSLATLYRPNANYYYSYTDGSWIEYDRITHNLGRCCVIPMTNRARIGDRHGRSEMSDVIGITDAACRSLTNLQGAQELLAVPQRYLLGATAADFKDQNGNPIPAWEAYIGRYALLANDQAKAGQFPAADLRNFTEVMNIYARLIAGISGLPPAFLGMATDNPASADAIRSSEARLVMRTQDHIVPFGGAWEEMMRVGIGWVDGTIPEASAKLETIWASPETPTFSAKADAVSKLVAAGIMPPDAALEELGYTDTQIKRWSAMRPANADPIGSLAQHIIGGPDLGGFGRNEPAGSSPSFG